MEFWAIEQSFFVFMLLDYLLENVDDFDFFSRSLFINLIGFWDLKIII
jgi:hypothetical protein